VKCLSCRRLNRGLYRGRSISSTLPSTTTRGLLSQVPGGIGLTKPGYMPAIRGEKLPFRPLPQVEARTNGGMRLTLRESGLTLEQIRSSRALAGSGRVGAVPTVGREIPSTSVYRPALRYYA